MDHCALMEVLYYALCRLPGWSRGELTKFSTMVMVLEGYKTFGPLQLKRIDWKQEMFAEGDNPERECEKVGQSEDSPNWAAARGKS